MNQGESLWASGSLSPDIVSSTEDPLRISQQLIPNPNEAVRTVLPFVLLIIYTG